MFNKNFLDLNKDNLNNKDKDKDDNTSMDTMISFSTMYQNPMDPFASMPFSENSWKYIYNLNLYNNNYSPINLIKNKPNEVKMNVLFRTNVGSSINLIIEQEKTIHELIQEYFKKINKLDFREDDYYFIFNAQKINYNDETKLRDFFRKANQPIIYVNNARDLIGANQIIIIYDFKII